MGDGGEGNDVSPRERAHQRHRDRKRRTRMVVDNAGVRRVLPAVRRRADREQQPRDTPQEPKEP